MVSMRFGIGRRKSKGDRYTMELDESTTCPSYETRKVRVGLRTYEIPVDSTGHVPTWAIVSRFHEVMDCDQRRDDIHGDAGRILPPRLTPEEIVSWWADPSSYDIEGVDTANSEFYDVSSIEDPMMRELQERIAVIARSRDEMERIRHEISEAFLPMELDEMTRDHSIIIQTVPDGGDAYGVYMRKQRGVPTPIIIYEEGASADSIVHEMVHHLRTMPSRKGKGHAQSKIPQTPDGDVDLDELLSMPSVETEKVQEKEEIETVIETELRTKKNETSGYYDDVHNGKSPKKAHMEDLHVLKGKDINKRIRGSQAVKRVNLSYDKTNIAKAEIMSRDSAKVLQKKKYTGGK